MSVKALREKRGKLYARFKAVINLAEKDDRDLTAEENSELERLHKEDAGLKNRIQQAERLLALDSELSAPALGQGDAGLYGCGSLVGEFGDAPGLSDAAPPTLFKDQTTGKVVRGLRHRDLLVEQRFRGGDAEAEEEGRTLPDIGDFLVARLTGRIEESQRQRYLNLSTADANGGLLLQPEFAAGFIDLARSASVCSKAGAITLPLTAAEMIFAVLASDPVSTWRHPGVTVPPSDISLFRITMHPRTLACVIPVQVELIEDAPNAGMILKHSLAASMGLALDQAALGVNAPQPAMPVGLLNTGGLNVISGVGAPASYVQIGQAVTDILTANYSGEVEDLAWCQHPRDAETYDALVDTLGQPLRPTPFASKLQRFYTTSFPTNGGEGSNQSSMVVGDFSQMIIGMRTGGVTIRVLDSGMFIDSSGVTWEAATSLQRLVVAYLRADVAILRPSFFTALTGVTP